MLLNFEYLTDTCFHLVHNKAVQSKNFNHKNVAEHHLYINLTLIVYRVQ